MSLLAVGVLITAGCGALDELVLDSAKLAARQAVEDAVSEVVDDTIDQLLDLDDAVVPLLGPLLDLDSIYGHALEE